MDKNKKQFPKIVWVILGIMIGLGLLAAIFVPIRWLNQNDVKTGLSLAYPELVPRFYSETPDRVFEEALGALEKIGRCEILQTSPETGLIVATRKTRLMKFTDDIEIIVDGGFRGSIVNIGSSSRVGTGDFGQNARNIIAIQSAMDEVLTRTDVSKSQE